MTGDLLDFGGQTEFPVYSETPRGMQVTAYARFVEINELTAEELPPSEVRFHKGKFYRQISRNP